MPVSVPTVSPVVLADAARGLAQQMVLWGHDVRHPGGNALIAYGLVRSPSPGLGGTSCYSMPWEHGRIELHGAVASWSTPGEGPGCVFCRDRGRIELWPGPEAPVPGFQHGESGSVTARWEAFRPLLRWLVDYESWVARELGDAWRHGTWQALKRLPKGKPWIPPADALRWWRLALAGQAPRPKRMAGTKPAVPGGSDPLPLNPPSGSRRPHRPRLPESHRGS
jgi:hypothetical protein